MESYATALNIGIPIFVLLIAIEFLVSKWRGVTVVRAFDMVSSLSSGMTNIIRDVIGLTVVIVSYAFMVEHLALFHIESTLLVYVLAFIGKDFVGYWAHRFEHQINIFWNRHIVHHSSEEFNLACALRQSISNIFGIFFFLYVPMALLGIPAKVVAIIAPIHLFLQFWYHTRLIDKMGFLEHIIVTPSHHRVHHAINDEYLDKNFGQIFILWDKWFGTFQEELRDKPPVYGVKKAVKTWNPVIINYQHLWLLIKDAWRTQNLWDKARIWFMPTGWRPADVRKKYPIAITTNPYTQKKYETSSSLPLKIWSFMQLNITLLLMLYLFNRIADFSFLEVVLYGFFLVVSIFAYTSLMDGSRINLPAEFFKMVLGIGLIAHINSWYLIDEFIPAGTAMMMGYLFVSMMGAVYFSYFDKAKVTVLQRQ